MQIQITVPAVPVAQPRARAAHFGGHTRLYTPATAPVQAFKATVRLAFAEAFSGSPLQGPLRCDLVFVMPRSKSLIWKTKPMPRLHHAIKPDRDNLDKAVMDALKGLAWNDDAQVCQGTIEKWIASGDESPHVEITISELTENPKGESWTNQQPLLQQTQN